MLTVRSAATHVAHQMRHFQTRATPSLRSLALNLRLIQGHTDYTRFIILGRSRSGTNLLRGLLNAHSRVLAFGELFQNADTISWGLSDYGQSDWLLSLFRSDAIRFLESQVFRRMPKHIEAVGFKLFYYHAHTPEWEPLWAYLAAQPQLRVIHIKRNNLLRTYLSRMRAALTDRWVNLTGEKEVYEPIYLDYEKCLADFTQTRAWEQQYEQFFAQQPMLTVHFESLASDYNAEMQRVQAFLGIQPEAVAPQTHRQSHEPLSAAIANYAELKEKFTGTPWQDFFED
jgi:LPS sulfotransferase NodH